MAILILEDDRAMLRAWQRAADREGVAVRCCATLNDAVLAVGAEEITGVVSDFHLGPRETSLPLLQATSSRDLPIVVTTGTASAAAEAIATAGLHAEILEKPLWEPLSRILRRLETRKKGSGR